MPCVQVGTGHPGGELLLPASSAPHAQTEASGLWGAWSSCGSALRAQASFLSWVFTSPAPRVPFPCRVMPTFPLRSHRWVAPPWCMCSGVCVCVCPQGKIFWLPNISSISIKQYLKQNNWRKNATCPVSICWSHQAVSHWIHPGLVHPEGT